MILLQFLLLLLLDSSFNIIHSQLHLYCSQNPYAFVYQHWKIAYWFFPLCLCKIFPFSPRWGFLRLTSLFLILYSRSQSFSAKKNSILWHAVDEFLFTVICIMFAIQQQTPAFGECPFKSSPILKIVPLFNIPLCLSITFIWYGTQFHSTLSIKLHFLFCLCSNRVFC